MTKHWDGFEAFAGFDAGTDLEAWLKAVPARRAVYLMVDVEGRAVQLLCVANLKASLRKRLGEQEVATRKVDYRAVVRGVWWRRVDSVFEADWVYLEAARAVFPETYRGMLGFRGAWFVRVDPAEPFPRLVKTNKVVGIEGELLGPVEDKHAANRLIELAEGVFDLCRYYNVLVEAPRGKACAYKEMGRCSAPCDGTVSMGHYRGVVREAVEGMVRPGEVVRRMEARMAEAAGALKFEEAGRIKGRIEPLRQLGKGPFRHVRRIEEFAYVAMQRGHREGVVKLFVVSGGEIEEVAAIIGDGVWGELTNLASESAKRPETEEEGERVAMVAHHLYSPKKGRGVFLWIGEVDEKSVGKAYREVAKQKEAQESEQEGVEKELTNQRMEVSEGGP